MLLTYAQLYPESQLPTEREASLSAGGTTCKAPGDLSGYWMPTLYNGTQQILPVGPQVIYYKAGVTDYTSVRHAVIPEQAYSPFELGLGRLVSLDKRPYVGKRALLAEQVELGDQVRPAGALERGEGNLRDAVDEDTEGKPLENDGARRRHRAPHPHAHPLLCERDRDERHGKDQQHHGPQRAIVQVQHAIAVG